MIFDALLQPSYRQAVTTTAPSTDYIDTGAANRAIGDDTRMTMVVRCDETVTAAGAATVAVTVQDSADGSTWADSTATPPASKSTLVAGWRALIPVPKNLRRYVRVNYTVANGPLATGKFSAQIALDVDRRKAMPNGI